MSTPVQAAPPPLRSTRSVCRWDWVRRALLVGWVLFAVTVVIIGERPASLTKLESDLTSGRVGTVRLAGGPPADAEGSSILEVRYRDGGFARRVEVWQVSPGAVAPENSIGGDQLETVTASNIGRDLERRHPGLRVVQEDPPQSFATVGSWWVPLWAGAWAIALSAAVLGVLLAGPRPWRATRWAWFWITSTPVGVLAFLVLAARRGRSQLRVWVRAG